MKGEYEKMLDYYPLLVESAIVFKIESRKIIANNENKEFVRKDEYEECKVASSYKLEKYKDKVYCLKEDQSIENRLQ